ncbi:uncharacterized protein LOC131944365 [Physella acuta]|uniref:uncharacterized protein LOC131944365 n=1 Tax=Physella acuta TaxID=109671 RepID=UPI0027DB20A0|nr:uncharacterized protein LOC131944365 [Physella acuta]
MISFQKAGLLYLYALMWSAPNASSGQLIEVDLNKGLIYNTPIYCSTAVPDYFNCKPSACYWSGSRSECCMYRYTRSDGLTLDQCKCSNKVNCPVVSTTTTTTTTTTPITTTPHVETDPIYCTAATEANNPKLCSNDDSCFLSSTKNKCCFTARKIYSQLFFETEPTLKLDPQCHCSADVDCLVLKK